MKFNLIDELCVVSIEDPFWGNKVLVFYVSNNSKQEDLIKSEFINYSLEHFTSIEMPDDYIWIKNPKNKHKKNQKETLNRFV